MSTSGLTIFLDPCFTLLVRFIQSLCVRWINTVIFKSNPRTRLYYTLVSTCALEPQTLRCCLMTNIMRTHITTQSLHGSVQCGKNKQVSKQILSNFFNTPQAWRNLTMHYPWSTSHTASAKLLQTNYWLGECTKIRIVRYTVEVCEIYRKTAWQMQCNTVEFGVQWVKCIVEELREYTRL